MSEYHYGITIREYRELAGLTQSELAALWPKKLGDKGVSPDYIYLVESGKKHITDLGTLRRICSILKMPYWKVGLSEFDPFGTTEVRDTSMYDETLNTAESLIKRTWWARRTAPTTYVKECVDDLNRLFAYLQENMPPPLRLEQRFQILYAQTLRLNAVLAVETQHYEEARKKFREMGEVARSIEHPATLAVALLGQGTELDRAGRHDEAIELLEDSRDVSFRASKPVIALVNAYLARVYASLHRAREFKRAIDVAQNVAFDIKMSYGDGTDFVFHSISGILAEKSYGYLEIGEPQETLDMRKQIADQIALEGNVWLDAWIPLDWARAYLMLKDIEKAVVEGRSFYHKALSLRSPHAQSRAFRLLNTMEAAGYQDAPSVAAFRKELYASGDSLNPGDQYPLVVV